MMDQEEITILPNPDLETVELSNGKLVGDLTPWMQEAYQNRVDQGIAIDELIEVEIPLNDLERWESSGGSGDTLCSWIALGFSATEAQEWTTRAKVDSPSKAAVFRDHHFSLDDMIQARSMVDSDEYRYVVMDEISRASDPLSLLTTILDIKHQSGASLSEAEEWYRDNWSVESAVRHIKAGRDIRAANIEHIRESIGERLGVDQIDEMLNSISDPTNILETRNLRNGIDALVALVDDGRLDPSDAVAWVEADFISLSGIWGYLDLETPLSQAQESERHLWFLKTGVFDDDLVGIDGLSIVEYAAREFPFNLKYRRQSVPDQIVASALVFGRLVQAMSNPDWAQIAEWSRYFSDPDSPLYAESVREQKDLLDEYIPAGATPEQAEVLYRRGARDFMSIREEIARLDDEITDVTDLRDTANKTSLR